jgi:hypothetical protein
MATVLEDRTTEEHRSVMRFLCGHRDSMQKDIHKEMFPVYGGKCLSRKAVGGKRFDDDEEVETDVRK